MNPFGKMILRSAKKSLSLCTLRTPTLLTSRVDDIKKKAKGRIIWQTG